jgi:hypothetical protein
MRPLWDCLRQLRAPVAVRVGRTAARQPQGPCVPTLLRPAGRIPQNHQAPSGAARRLEFQAKPVHRQRQQLDASSSSRFTVLPGPGRHERPYRVLEAGDPGQHCRGVHVGGFPTGSDLPATVCRCRWDGWACLLGNVCSSIHDRCRRHGFCPGNVGHDSLCHGCRWRHDGGPDHVCYDNSFHGRNWRNVWTSFLHRSNVSHHGGSGRERRSHDYSWRPLLYHYRGR